MTDRTPLFKDVTTDLNQVYRECISMYQIGDTRTGYLRTFELVLSQCCPDMQVWNFPAYKSMIPLPEDPRQRLSPGYYYNWLIVYEQIMREVGLIDKDPASSQSQSDIPTFEMEGC